MLGLKVYHVSKRGYWESNRWQAIAYANDNGDLGKYEKQNIYINQVKTMPADALVSCISK